MLFNGHCFFRDPYKPAHQSNKAGSRSCPPWVEHELRLVRRSLAWTKVADNSEDIVNIDDVVAINITITVARASEVANDG